MRSPMLPIALAVGLAPLVGCGLTPASPVTNQPRSTNGQHLDATRYRADGVDRTRVLVTFRNSPDALALDQLEARTRFQVDRRIPAIGAAVLRISGSPEAAVAQLSSDPAIAHAELDRAIILDDVTVNDPERSKQYGLDKIRAGKAWDLTRGSEQVVIGIVDSGVDTDHPDLRAKLLPGVNTVDPTLTVRDDVGHGTHVAGIAAASTNNGVGIAGIASQCKVLPVKALSTAFGSVSSVAQGVIWAVDHGADVINMSLGINEPSEVLTNAVQYALSKNVVLVATMGNKNVEAPRYPASIPGVIAVGSTDSTDRKSRFSNYGAWMSVSAPGTDIFSTFPTYPVSIPASNGNAGYEYMSGTSMAAPLVTGLCALVRSKHPDLAPAEVKRLIERTAVDLGDRGADKMFGNGRIDAFAALSK